MTQPSSALIWDSFTRLFHWLLVASIGLAWWTAEQGGDWMEWHLRCGYAVLSLVGFRLIWGFVGSRYARFGSFVRSPANTLDYAKSLKAGSAPEYQGHNPLGGWMVIALLLLALTQAATGLFANDDIFTEGPLASLISYDLSIEITRWHEALFNVILVAIGLHLAGVFFHQLVKKEKLIQAMIHGRKPAAPQTAITSQHWLRGLILAAAFAGLFVWLGF
ncbi:cytochrome b/b6 domain-containing protein [Bacterioplanoides pacificum]|uniref:Cytochrome b/b6 domain-containing protein n=1 Tax=Bacterioplanoides pacificum TaxID=1171596 RepID=A0ABV7VW65_9GAMM